MEGILKCKLESSSNETEGYHGKFVGFVFGLCEIGCGAERSDGYIRTVGSRQQWEDNWVIGNRE